MKTISIVFNINISIPIILKQALSKYSYTTSSNNHNAVIEAAVTKYIYKIVPMMAKKILKIVCCNGRIIIEIIGVLIRMIKKIKLTIPN